MNELTINYIQLFYILISFEFLIKFTLAYCVVSTITDTKCSCSFSFRVRSLRGHSVYVYTCCVGVYVCRCRVHEHALFVISLIDRI